jgi:hypothetical protein
VLIAFLIDRDAACPAFEVDNAILVDLLYQDVVVGRSVDVDVVLDRAEVKGHFPAAFLPRSRGVVAAFAEGLRAARRLGRGASL